MTVLADLYLHPGIESFAYPDSNSQVQYIGALPPPAGQPALRLVEGPRSRQALRPHHAGHHRQQRLQPGLAPARVALHGREDMTLIVTTGGQRGIASRFQLLCPANVGTRQSGVSIDELLF